MTGDGGGAPLPAEGPKGTFGEYGGPSTCLVVYDLTLTDDTSPHLEFCSPNTFSF